MSIEISTRSAGDAEPKGRSDAADEGMATDSDFAAGPVTEAALGATGHSAGSGCPFLSSPPPPPPFRSGGCPFASGTVRGATWASPRAAGGVPRQRPAAAVLEAYDEGGLLSDRVTSGRVAPTAPTVAQHAAPTLRRGSAAHAGPHLVSWDLQATEDGVTDSRTSRDQSHISRGESRGAESAVDGGAVSSVPSALRRRGSLGRLSTSGMSGGGVVVHLGNVQVSGALLRALGEPTSTPRGPPEPEATMRHPRSSQQPLTRIGGSGKPEETVSGGTWSAWLPPQSSRQPRSSQQHSSRLEGSGKPGETASGGSWSAWLPRQSSRQPRISTQLSGRGKNPFFMDKGSSFSPRNLDRIPSPSELLPEEAEHSPGISNSAGSANSNELAAPAGGRPRPVRRSQAGGQVMPRAFDSGLMLRFIADSEIALAPGLEESSSSRMFSPVCP